MWDLIRELTCITLFLTVRDTEIRYELDVKLMKVKAKSFS